ncbi:hypothetical protein D7D52_20930 [Nocardia yunnanensis]|uniref:Uncharacterized protein n=1 Tax=Nocardia yunnanensis TaxID=2382165 RepID=A0A386ZH30_9NOCA|nr:hypothetical protein D7D52_20930 [Nocardia yunnanensis]
MLGPVAFDEFELGFDMGYAVDPLGAVALGAMHSGVFARDRHDQFHPPELRHPIIGLSAECSAATVETAVHMTEEVRPMNGTTWVLLAGVMVGR